jgi:chromosomal replication initiation ATPase DnaA
MNSIQITTDYAAWTGFRTFSGEIIEPRYPMSRDIIKQTALDHGLTIANMLGPKRDRRHARARFDAAARLRAVTHGGKPRYSLPQIGQMLGGRDHTTILSGLRRWAKLQAKRA